MGSHITIQPSRVIGSVSDEATMSCGHFSLVEKVVFSLVCEYFDLSLRVTLVGIPNHGLESI